VPDFITKKNCLDIFRLSKFWCDEFVATQAESFIKENIDKEIYKTIMKNVELQALLEVVVDKFTDFMFTQVKNTKECFDTYQIQKFDPLKCVGLESNLTFVYNHTKFESTCMKNTYETQPWETIFTEKISDYHKNTVINFRTISGPKSYGLENVYVGIVDEDIKNPKQISSFTSTKLKYCAFRLTQLVVSSVDKTKVEVDRTSMTCYHHNAVENKEIRAEAIPILNTAPPISNWLRSDKFKLKYNRDSKLDLQP
jgi:hypothetical protein